MAKGKCTGLSISRNNNVLTFKWSLPAKYQGTGKGILKVKTILEGQTASKVPFTDVNLAAQTKSFTLPITGSSYYPATDKVLRSVIFKVRMGSSEKFTFSDECTYTFITPSIAQRPTLSYDGSTGFKWVAAGYTAKDNVWFQDVEYQTVNSPQATEPNWAASSVTSGTGGSTGTQDFPSDPSGYRHFRCRVRTIGGASPWTTITPLNFNSPTYYVLPKTVKYSGGTVSMTLSDRVYGAQEVEVQYAIETPASGYTCPSGASWSTGQTVTINATDSIIGTPASAIAFNVGSIAANKALWVRTITRRGGGSLTSSAVYVANGGFSAPTINSFSIDTTVKTVTFTFTDNCGVSGARVEAVDSSLNVLGSVAAGSSGITCSYASTSSTPSPQFGLRVVYTNSFVIVKSATVWQSTAPNLPTAPTGVSAGEAGSESKPSGTGSGEKANNGKVLLRWTTTWEHSNGAIISWADDPDAWESTTPPNEFEVHGRVNSFYVTDLEYGKKWYFKIRSVHWAEDNDDNDSYGPWCGSMIMVDLSEAPDKPGVWLDVSTITTDKSVTVNWEYMSGDGTDQEGAEIYIDTEMHSIEGTTQSYTFTPAWAVGTSHTLSVRTISTSGKKSPASDPITVTVAALPVPVITTSWGGVSGTVTAMPMTYSVSGAGLGGYVTVALTRVNPFVEDRPDGSRNDGFVDEVIYSKTHMGDVTNAQIAVDDLIGHLDDGQAYNFIVTVTDGYGQTVTSKGIVTIAWAHQPDIPDLTVVPDGNICKITATAPASAVSSDTVDIYRLSKDAPVLIVKGGEFGETYVDPYPASKGGYRAVDMTANGDYRGADKPAIMDVEHGLVIDDIVLTVPGYGEINLPYNITLNSDWAKDFERTVYLNGSVQGDWNPGVTRDVSIETVLLKDDPLIDDLRHIAELGEVCHIRTPDGSSYDADVQISESGSYDTYMTQYTLKASKVDPEGLDGMTLAEWEDQG